MTALDVSVDDLSCAGASALLTWLESQDRLVREWLEAGLAEILRQEDLSCTCLLHSEARHRLQQAAPVVHRGCPVT